MTNKKVKIYVDFDETITDIDVFNFLMEKFTKSNWRYYDRLYQEGKISSFKCVDECTRFLKDVSKEQLRSSVDHIEIDKGFKEFLKLCRKKKYSVEIVSDGLDIYIDEILGVHDVRGVTVKCNRYLGDGAVSYPYRKKLCRKDCANCKKSNIDQSSFSIYIGDGINDECVAEICDLVFAKDTLATFLNKTNKKYFRFKDFSDVCKILNNLNLT